MITRELNQISISRSADILVRSKHQMGALIPSISARGALKGAADRNLRAPVADVLYVTVLSNTLS